MPGARNNFEVTLTDHAITDLKGIPADQQDQINRELKALQSNPFPRATSIKRLKGFHPPLYRLRSGNFRILYRIQERTVIILRVIDRKILDRILRRSGI